MNTPVKRYQVVSGSQSAHCCFDATVVDTTKPDLNADGSHFCRKGVPQFEPLCECFEETDAQLIADALNFYNTHGHTP